MAHDKIRRLINRKGVKFFFNYEVPLATSLYTNDKKKSECEKKNL